MKAVGLTYAEFMNDDAQATNGSSPSVVFIQR